MQKEFKNHYFYSFGVSGSQLSQYIAYAKYATENYKAEKLIITIIENDFNECFYTIKKVAGFWYFDKDEGNLFLVPTPAPDFRKEVIRWVVKNSYLMRYLFFYSGLLIRVNEIFKSNNKKNIQKDTQLSKEAIDFFFLHLEKNIKLKSQDIIFVIDAPRKYIYQGKIDEAKNSFFGITREQFIKEAKSKNYFVVDMLPVFFEHYLKNKKNFEFSTDGHWNELGHYLVAQEIGKILN